MALKIASALALAGLDAVTASIDAGAGTASLVVYSGTEPASVTAALAGNTALVTYSLPEPPFTGAVDDTTFVEAVANPIATVQAADDGIATFFRILDNTGAPVIQGNVSEANLGGDLEISSVNVITGVDVVAISLSIQFPKE